METTSTNGAATMTVKLGDVVTLSQWGHCRIVKILKSGFVCVVPATATRNDGELTCLTAAEFIRTYRKGAL